MREETSVKCLSGLVFLRWAPLRFYIAALSRTSQVVCRGLDCFPELPRG